MWFSSSWRLRCAGNISFKSQVGCSNFPHGSTDPWHKQVSFIPYSSCFGYQLLKLPLASVIQIIQFSQVPEQCIGNSLRSDTPLEGLEVDEPACPASLTRLRCCCRPRQILYAVHGLIRWPWGASDGRILYISIYIYIYVDIRINIYIYVKIHNLISNNLRAHKLHRDTTRQHAMQKMPWVLPWFLLVGHAIMMSHAVFALTAIM